MKISVDGGALDQNKESRFGTAVYSENLIKALKLFDKKNQYHFYTFKNLKPKLFWLKGRVSLEELKKKKDVFLALNQAIPFYVSGKIISISHGLSFKSYPDIYPKNHIARMTGQLNEMVKRSAKIIVSSERVKAEFLSNYPKIASKLIVLPFGLPFDMIDVKPIHKRRKYFLFVGNYQKIKNIDYAIEAFIKSGLNKKGYEFFLVGRWAKFQDRKNGIIAIGNVSRTRLKKLYRESVTLLTSSFYESFNFPVLEALSQGCPVIGLETAVVPELRPFSNIAEDKTKFISLIKNAADNQLKTVPVSKIRKMFSWKSYVKNLVRLY